MNILRKELRPDFAPAEKLYPLPKKSLIKDKEDKYHQPTAEEVMNKIWR